MDKQSIVAQYGTSTAKVNKVLKALEFDHNASDFSPEQLELFERFWTLTEKEGQSYKEAIALVRHQSNLAQDEVLAPELTDFLREKSQLFADQILADAPHILQEQRAAAKRIIVSTFWQRVNEIGRSEEFQRKFDAALYGEATFDVAVLPGESSALPENSSSDT